MLKPLTKTLVAVEVPRQTDEYDVTLPYWLINAYHPGNYYKTKCNVVVEVAEAEPQKRTIVIKNESFFSQEVYDRLVGNLIVGSYESVAKKIIELKIN